MAGKKQVRPEEGRPARGGGGRGATHTATSARRPTPEATGNAPRGAPQEAPAAPGGATGRPPAGPDEARQVAAQRAEQQAEVMREALFAAMMAEALGYENLFDSRAYRAYLQRLLDDAGNPADPVERMMLEQLALAHFRIGQLQVSAGKSKGTEATKIFSSAASRLLGEFRRTALALRAYRTRQPEARPEKNLKLFKAAQ